VNPDVILTLLVVAVPVMGTMGYHWFKASHDLRRLQASHEPRQVEERLTRVEHALDALMQQNERLVETQDFLSRIVADRLPLPRSSESPHPRQVTPH
jgi:cytochrome c-type biogenesis protein CcmH/NrfG